MRELRGTEDRMRGIEWTSDGITKPATSLKYSKLMLTSMHAKPLSTTRISSYATDTVNCCCNIYHCLVKYSRFLSRFYSSVTPPTEASCTTCHSVSTVLCGSGRTKLITSVSTRPSTTTPPGSALPTTRSSGYPPCTDLSSIKPCIRWYEGRLD